MEDVLGWLLKGGGKTKTRCLRLWKKIGYTAVMYRRVCLSAVLLLSIAPAAFAGMTGTSYRIDWDVLNAGGSDDSSSASYAIQDSIGETVAGEGSSTSYELLAGYRAGIGDITRLSLNVHAQNSQTPASSYSLVNIGSREVTVATPGAFMAGDEVALIEDPGSYGQLIAVGKVQSIAGSVLTLDAVSGDTLTMNATPVSGAIYLLSGSALAFGTLSASVPQVISLDTAVRSTAPLGYSVYLQGATLLQNSGSQSLATVTDGTVSLGSEEYGAEVTGALAAGPTGDQGVTTTARLIQSSATVTGAVPDRVAMNFKIAITAATNEGSYSQTVYYTLTPRF